HPVAAALLATIARYQLPLEPLQTLLDARRFDLYDEPMRSLVDFETYSEGASAGVFVLPARNLARTDTRALNPQPGLAPAPCRPPGGICDRRGGRPPLRATGYPDAPWSTPGGRRGRAGDAAVARGTRRVAGARPPASGRGTKASCGRAGRGHARVAAGRARGADARAHGAARLRPVHAG